MIIITIKYYIIIYQAFTYLFIVYSPWNSPGQNTGVGKPFPSPGDLPNPGIEPRSPTLQMDSLPAEPPGKPSQNVGCTNTINLNPC